MYVTGHCREVDCQISGVSCTAPHAVLTISYANSALREIEEPCDYSGANYLKSHLECGDYSAPGLADAVIQDHCQENWLTGDPHRPISDCNAV
jgi:hypothetical protein